MFKKNIRISVFFSAALAALVCIASGSCKEPYSYPGHTGPAEYGIALNQNMPYTFLPLELDYDNCPEKSFIITNNKRLPTGTLTIELVGPQKDYFEVSAKTVESLASLKTAIFTVKLKQGLFIGTHSAGVRITGEHGIQAGFDLNVSVFGVIKLTDSSPVSLSGVWSYSGGVYTILNRAIVTIEGSVSPVTNRRIEVAQNAKADVTFQGVKIDASGLSAPAFLLKSGSEVNLTLLGTSELKGADSYAGLQAPAGTYLTINGAGDITLTGGDYGAGIGGGDGETCGTLRIMGGITDVTGGASAAAMGGGRNGAGGNITIDGGTVRTGIAYFYSDGAGIGGGTGGEGGLITITAGWVFA
jgi:hypothetical protein